MHDGSTDAFVRVLVLAVTPKNMLYLPKNYSSYIFLCNTFFVATVLCLRSIGAV